MIVPRSDQAPINSHKGLTACASGKTVSLFERGGGKWGVKKLELPCHFAMKMPLLRYTLWMIGYLRCWLRPIRNSDGKCGRSLWLYKFDILQNELILKKELFNRQDGLYLLSVEISDTSEYAIYVQHDLHTDQTLLKLCSLVTGQSQILPIKGDMLINHNAWQFDIKTGTFKRSKLSESIANNGDRHCSSIRFQGDTYFSIEKDEYKYFFNTNIISWMGENKRLAEILSLLILP